MPKITKKRGVKSKKKSDYEDSAKKKKTKIVKVLIKRKGFIKKDFSIQKKY